MLERMKQAVAEMQADRLLSIRERGLIVTCVEGAIWITRDEDRMDKVLVPGERFECADRRRVLIQALVASRVRLQRCAWFLIPCGWGR